MGKQGTITKENKVTQKKIASRLSPLVEKGQIMNTVRELISKGKMTWL